MGPLLAGATTIVFEGKPIGTPDAGVFWRVIEEHKVKGSLHSSYGHPCHQAGGPGGDLSRGSTTYLTLKPSSSLASAWTQTPSSGPADLLHRCR